jgi:G3E family GTPase
VGRPDIRSDSAVPLVILTGFLGAGKTTVLNRALGAHHQRRVAVLVNELGRIDIDAALIRGRAGDVLELAGGCVCHQIGVQRELWSALADIVERARPDVVVLETTGIAEPEAILRGIERLEERGDRDGDADGDGDVTGSWSPALVEERRRLALQGVISRRTTAVVTVVDGEAGEAQLAKHDEARAQVVAADGILISKVELVPAAALAGLHRTLNELNPRAERAAFPRGSAGTAALVPWLLDARPLPDRRHAADRHAHRAHAHQLAAATYVDDAPLVGPALVLALDGFGERLVRAKGFVLLEGEERRGVLQRAGGRTVLELGDAWGNEPRLTRLVLIGEELDEAALHRRLWACRSPRGQTASIE